MSTPLQEMLQFYTRAVPPNVMTLVQQATGRETCESWYRILQATFSCETLSRDRAKLLRQYLCGFREQMGLLAFITHLLGARADSYTHQKRCELAISFSPPCCREALRKTVTSMAWPPVWASCGRAAPTGVISMPTWLTTITPYCGCWTTSRPTLASSTGPSGPTPWLKPANDLTKARHNGAPF